MVQLDGLRALAALLVIVAHGLQREGKVGWLCGVVGVYTFFVLSGYLITGILLDCKSIPNRRWVFKAFYARRTLRIFPLYYAVLFLVVAAGSISARREFWWFLVYAGNIYDAIHDKFSGVLVHFWSLAVEEQFYLVWPAVILLIPSRALPWVFRAAIAISPLSVFLICRLASATISASLATTSNIAYLAMGAFLIWKQRDGVDGPEKAARFARLCGLAGLALAGGCMILDQYTTRSPALRVAGEFFGIGLACVWLVQNAARGFGPIIGGILTSRPLVYLGQISYGLYVYHYLIIIALQKAGVPLGVTMFLLTLGLTVPVAALSWHFFERPINDLKRLFPYRKRPVEQPAIEPQPALGV